MCGVVKHHTFFFLNFHGVTYVMIAVKGLLFRYIRIWLTLQILYHSHNEQACAMQHDNL